MSRKFAYSTPTEQMQQIICVQYQGSAGDQLHFNFLDGTFTYYGKPVRYAMDQCIIDNIGNGQVRLLINGPKMNLSMPIEGSKTLLPKDIMKLELDVISLEIYFIEDSIVEIIGIPRKDESES